MRYRSTAVLFALFLAGLGVLWWADYTKVPDRDKQRELVNRLLPELIDTPVTDVHRIEIEPGPGAGTGAAAIVVERRGDGSWQMTRPIDAAADVGLVETLARNLKDLRKSTDAGTIRGDPAPYGLDRPVATVKVFGNAEGGSPGTPLAVLDVGKTERKRVYVRPGGAGGGIEVVDAVLLGAITAPPARWRDTSLFHVPSFRVAGVDVERPGPDRALALRRDERHWRIDRPIKAPADDDKAEGLVAELAALRVADGVEGFVKDGVPAAGLAEYGLDKPSMTITVTPFGEKATPQSLRLGNPVPGKENQVYAVRGDQDDVVRVEVKLLREAIPGVNGLRSAKVLDVIPQRVNRLRIDARGKPFDLARTPRGWELLSPVREPADTASVQTLLTRLAELKASEFLEASRVPEPRLDPPNFRVRGWQAEPGAPAPTGSAGPGEPQGEPRFDLSLGRVDALRKTVYGRLAGDETLLALPDPVVAALPRNEFAYRDLSVLRLNPQQVSRLSLERGGTVVTVEAPGAAGPANRWTMVEPVRGPADTGAVTALIVALADLRAENWESDSVGDGTAFGLDTPALRVRWSLSRPPGAPTGAPEPEAGGALRVGKVKPGSGLRYANIEGDPRVFTLGPAALAPFDAEPHDKTVMTFKADAVERVALDWPSYALTLNRFARPGSGKPEWQPSVGFDNPGFDPARAGALVAALADLKTPRFIRYTGPIPEAAGLDHPRLTVRVKVAGERNERRLRVGNSVAVDSYAATTAEGDSGPVFVLKAADTWKALLKPPARPDDLPDDVFARGGTR